MDRRTFLRAAGIAAGCAVAGGIAGGYPLARKLVRDQFEVVKTGFMEVLVRRYGESRGKALIEKIEEELRTALAQLPDLGPKAQNKWAGNMPPAALALAAHRVLVPAVATIEQLGEMLYRTVEHEVDAMVALIMRATYSEGAKMREARELSAFFQERTYPGNWVTAFVEGNGRDFTYGLDVTECAIVKYHRAQGVPDLSRYLCLIDNITMGAQGRGLVRTKTLAEGCDKCDFRFKHGRPNDVAPLRHGWPPRFDGCR